MYALFHTGQTYPYGKQGIQGRKGRNHSHAERLYISNIIYAELFSSHFKDVTHKIHDLTLDD